MHEPCLCSWSQRGDRNRLSPFPTLPPLTASAALPAWACEWSLTPRGLGPRGTLLSGWMAVPVHPVRAGRRGPARAPHACLSASLCDPSSAPPEHGVSQRCQGGEPSPRLMLLGCGSISQGSETLAVSPGQGKPGSTFFLTLLLLGLDLRSCRAKFEMRSTQPPVRH